MTTSTEYEKLLAQHQALQAETGAATADRVARAQALMAEIVAAGAHIREARRRETLRSILRYWGAWVFEQTGEYPPSQMMPAVPEAPLPSRPAWLVWAVAPGGRGVNSTLQRQPERPCPPISGRWSSTRPQARPWPWPA